MARRGSKIIERPVDNAQFKILCDRLENGETIPNIDLSQMPGMSGFKLGQLCGALKSNNTVNQISLDKVNLVSEDSVEAINKLTKIAETNSNLMAVKFGPNVIRPHIQDRTEILETAMEALQKQLEDNQQKVAEEWGQGMQDESQYWNGRKTRLMPKEILKEAEEFIKSAEAEAMVAEEQASAAVKNTSTIRQRVESTAEIAPPAQTAATNKNKMTMTGAKATQALPKTSTPTSTKATSKTEILPQKSSEKPAVKKLSYQEYNALKQYELMQQRHLMQKNKATSRPEESRPTKSRPKPSPYKHPK